jgi:hypothetical protein
MAVSTATVTLETALKQHLHSPVVLAYVFGNVITLVRSHFKFPEALYQSLTIYLLLAIGLEGGVALSHTPFSEFWAPALASLSLGVAIPLSTYFIVHRLGKFDVSNAAAIAAHYGSTSVVTFIASLDLLRALKVPYEGFMLALLSLPEVPAIIVSLLIAFVTLKKKQTSWTHIWHEILTEPSIMLVLGGLFIGYMAGEESFKQVAPVFVDPFRGILTLFLLDTGIVAAQRFRDLTKVGLFLVSFGIVMPIVYASLGICLGWLTGLSKGGSFVLGGIAAGASYIGAPIAVRLSLPKANPGYYLTTALAVTLPFNLTLGLPLYYTIAKLFYN